MKVEPLWQQDGLSRIAADVSYFPTTKHVRSLKSKAHTQSLAGTFNLDMPGASGSWWVPDASTEQPDAATTLSATQVCTGTAPLLRPRMHLTHSQPAHGRGAPGACQASTCCPPAADMALMPNTAGECAEWQYFHRCPGCVRHGSEGSRVAFRGSGKPAQAPANQLPVGTLRGCKAQATEKR